MTKISTDHPMAKAVHDAFALTEEEIQQTKITCGRKGFSIDFGPQGVAATPERKAKLLKLLMGVSSIA